jgi:hypothetical protein
LHTTTTARTRLSVYLSGRLSILAGSTQSAFKHCSVITKADIQQPPMFSHNYPSIEELGHPRYGQDTPVVC